MSIAKAFAAFFCGVLTGWIVIGSFMILHDRSGFDGALWLVALWFPVAVVYSVVIVVASHRLLSRFAPTLLLLLGCVVGLLPFCGFWPPYFVRPTFLPLYLGIHLTAVAIAASAWIFVVRLATRMGLTHR